MLIVLDNAADERQVEALLPAEAGNLVLITSRRSPAGLDDASALSLDVLSQAVAAELSRPVGADPVADGEAVTAIAGCCGPACVRVRSGHRPDCRRGCGTVRHRSPN